MDNSKTVNCIEWCFGYGGNHLGLARAIPGLRILAASEIEAYAVANLVAKMEAGLLDPFPIWSDCKTFPCEMFRDMVDLFIASYPCQPFSSAGKRGGADDPRHLWPYVRRAIEIILPRLVFFENVDGHVSLGLREVLTELALLGYRVENSRGEPTWGIFSATEVGAPHNRKRVFILGKRADELADINGVGYPHWQSEIQSAERRVNAQRDLAAGCGKISGLADDKHRSDGTEQTQQCEKCAEELSGGARLENSEVGRHERREQQATHGVRSPAPGPASERSRPRYWPGFVARPGEAQHEWEPPRTIGGTGSECGMGRGSPRRAQNVDALRLLGNGVYPETAALAFVTLYKRFSE